MQIIVVLEDSFKSTMVSSFEVRNKVIDAISEISNWEAKSFQNTVKSRVINVSMVMRLLFLSIWLLMIQIFEHSFHRTYFLTVTFQLERPSCSGNCSLQSMRLILGKTMESLSYNLQGVSKMPFV